MGVRYFVAAVPPEWAFRELDSVVEPLRDSFPGVTWTDLADWHLTLAFLGEIGAECLPALSGALADVATRTRPIQIRLTGSGHFDSRVLWAGVGGDVERLHELSRAVRAAASSAHVGFDDRPLRPHLTLGYARHRARADDGTVINSGRPAPAPDIQPIAESLTDFDGTPWGADRLHLMSVRSERSPRYGTVESWPLEPTATG